MLRRRETQRRTGGWREAVGSTDVGSTDVGSTDVVAAAAAESQRDEQLDSKHACFLRKQRLTA